MTFPIHLFPKSFRDAVEGLHAYTNAPPELSATIALGIAGFACQALFNTTAHRFKTTTSIFAIVLNESGGLKSEITKYLTRGISRFEELQRDKYQSAMAEYQADEQLWQTDAAEAKKEKDRAIRKRLIYDLEMDRPQKPFSPIRTVEAPTVVGLSRGFQLNGPSLLNLSTDAGVFLSGTTMSDAAQSKQMVSIMSKVWSGESYDRQTGDEQVLFTGKRLSCTWLVQGKMATEFLTNEMFQAQGIMARFLVIKAPRYVAPPATYANGNNEVQLRKLEQAVELFNVRVYELLQRGYALRQGTHDELDPPVFGWAEDTLQMQQDWVNTYCEPFRNSSSADDENLTFYQRLEEHCARVATVLAIMDGQSVVNKECARAGQALVEWIVASIQNLDRDQLPDSEEVKAFKALKGFVENKKGLTLSSRDLIKNGRKAFTAAKESVRNAAIRRAIDVGIMEAVEITRANNTKSDGYTISNDNAAWEDAA